RKTVPTVCFRQRHAHFGNRLAELARHERARLDVPGDHTTRADHSPFANPQNLSGRSHHHDVRPNITILLQDDPARASRVRQDGSPDADLHAILNFNSFRIFVLQIDFVADEDIFPDLDASQTVQEGTKAHRSRRKSSYQMKHPTVKFPDVTLGHRSIPYPTAAGCTATLHASSSEIAAGFG